MTNFVLQMWPTPSVAVDGGGRYPVRRIYCVGRNYAAHVREMGIDARQPPFFFTKPADAIVEDGGNVPYPPATTDFQHEIELVVAIGKEGAQIPVAAAPDHAFGYAAGIDLTRRDLQLAARDSGRPWDMGKAFDHSAPCGVLRPAAETPRVGEGAIWIKVNGDTRQASDLSDMIWNVAEIIAHRSGFVTLRRGDLIYTGTPEGVGAVGPGDRLHGHIDGVGEITVTIG